MYPQQHIIFGVLFSAFLLFLFPAIGMRGALIIFLSAVLIDVDHYIFYVYKKKDWNLKNAYNWVIDNGKSICKLPREQRGNFYIEFFFLHGIEIPLLFLLLAVFSKYFLFIFIGFAFHLLLDIVYQTVFWDRIDRFSLIYDFLKFKKLIYFERGKNI